MLNPFYNVLIIQFYYQDYFYVINMYNKALDCTSFDIVTVEVVPATVVLWVLCTK